MDCAGLVIAPGFIDVHSHMDRVVAFAGFENLKTPFTDQGCTTFIAGNCGNSAGSLNRFSRFFPRLALDDITDQAISWDSMAGYFDHLEKIGLTHNLYTFAGHGSAQVALRGLSPSPLSEEEMASLLRSLEEDMDQGAGGVSFGLGYEPGMFFSTDQIKAVARLVKKRGKAITVHGRAYSLLSGAYRERGGTPHNVLSMKEMIEVARETGVRLQYSHLMFAGTKSHPTYQECLEVMDAAIEDGVDVMIDTYPYHCGFSVINVLLPPWFLSNLPANYHDEQALDKVLRGLSRMPEHGGFGFNDIQLMHANHPDYEKLGGLFVSQIAEQVGLKPEAVVVDISEKTGGRARILNHNYSNMEIIDALIRHPACLFMTDSVVSQIGVQNPASFGSFPLLLQYARDRKLIPLEEAVRKMTGASAERMGIKDRGRLEKGFAADVTVFDWEKVRDNNTVTETDQRPTGIEAVFVNGVAVTKEGRVIETALPGAAIRV
jgi:N-acyl-D-aspartate/D-glutamate deacylase